MNFAICSGIRSECNSLSYESLEEAWMALFLETTIVAMIKQWSDKYMTYLTRSSTQKRGTQQACIAGKYIWR